MIVTLLTCRLLGMAVLVFRGDRAKDAELLVLRHEDAVLRRHDGRVRYEPADRAWFAELARLVPRRRWAGVFPVTPATLLAWHRRLAAKKYGTSKRRLIRAVARRPGSRRSAVRTSASKAVNSRRGVGEEQALAAGQPQQVRVPVLTVRRAVDELPWPDHGQELPRAPQDHQPMVWP
jgi:hypothetical protein